MNYRPEKPYGGWVGLFLGIVIFGFTIWGIGYALDDKDQTLKMMLYIPTFIFLVIYLYLVLTAFNLKYKVEKDALVIIWGLHKKRIPWDQIDEIIEVKGRPNLLPFLSASWQGYTIGLYSAKGLGSVRMFATHTSEGFLYIKSKMGFYGITPEDSSLATVVIANTGIAPQCVDMDIMPEEQKGECIHEDRFFNLYYHLNLIFLAILALYLGIFFPGSGAPRFVILLLVLAMALFIFNAANARRLYQFSSQGAYITLLIGIMVTGIFIILSVFSVGF